MVRYEKGVEPRQKCPVEGIDAANDEEEEKFPGEKMMSDMVDEMHAAGLHGYFVEAIIPGHGRIVKGG